MLQQKRLDERIGDTKLRVLLTKKRLEKAKNGKKLGEEINALVMNAYNLVQTNALKDKYADAKDRKLMLDLDAYEKDAGYKGTARSYIP